MHQYTGVAFYMVAHMDDWQLFMNPSAYRDMSSTIQKVVFMYITANDSGANENYWRANEEAARSSVRFGLPGSLGLGETSGVVLLNNHMVHRWSLGNAACYFLRLPDGNVDGSGFASGGYQSLQMLRRGMIPSITALDRSCVYSGWPDLIDLLQRIVERESEGIASIALHFPEANPVLNPGDHSDHYSAGLAVEAMPKYFRCHRYAYLGYALSESPPDLTGDDLFWKYALFIAYDRTLFDLTRYSLLKLAPATYITFCQRAGQFRYTPPQLKP